MEISRKIARPAKPVGLEQLKAGNLQTCVRQRSLRRALYQDAPVDITIRFHPKPRPILRSPSPTLEQVAIQQIVNVRITSRARARVTKHCLGPQLRRHCVHHRVPSGFCFILVVSLTRYMFDDVSARVKTRDPRILRSLIPLLSNCFSKRYQHGPWILDSPRPQGRVHLRDHQATGTRGDPNWSGAQLGTESESQAMAQLVVLDCASPACRYFRIGPTLSFIGGRGSQTSQRRMVRIDSSLDGSSKLKL